MLSKFLTHEVSLIRVNNAVAVGTTTITAATPIDMAANGGWDGVVFFVAFGAITDGTPGIQARQGQQSNMSDGATLLGSNVTIAVTDDNKMAAIEIHQPAERYLDCQVVRGGATGAVIDGIFALRYRPRKVPITQDASLAGVERYVAPAEGAA